MKLTTFSLGSIALCTALAGCGPSKKELQAELDQVRSQLAQSQASNQTLEEKIRELEGEIATQADRIAQMEAERGGLDAELAELRKEQERREAELATYKKLFAKLKKLVDAGTIKVSFREGRLVVEMASAVLFDSGRTDVKQAGKAALDELVEALMTVQDREFLVAGHTDNVPVRKRYSSNWELSTMRAVHVVDYMIEKGFPADHIGAAGYGETDPVASNDTEEGRAQNRRIEVILMPNLGEVEGIREMLES